jgi:hypothetical protein
MTEIGEEKRDDLQEAIARARKMETLTAVDGWKDLLLPYIKGGKKGALNSLLKTNDRDEMLRAQQAFNTLDSVEMFVSNEIAVGQAAREALAPKQDDGG